MQCWERFCYLENLERTLTKQLQKSIKVSAKQTFISVSDKVCFYLVIKLEQEEKNIFGKGD